jgi:hypothetical protein
MTIKRYIFEHLTNNVVVTSRVTRSRIVTEGIVDRAGVHDVSGANTIQVILRYIKIWDLLVAFTLPEVPNRFVRKWTASGGFSSASAYQALFIGCLSLLGASYLWKVQVSG